MSSKERNRIDFCYALLFERIKLMDSKSIPLKNRTSLEVISFSLKVMRQKIFK